MSPQELVERALAASTADGQIAYVTESSEANLRWASNSLTTNGAMRSRQVVYVTESSETNLRWASNSLTTNGAMRSRQVVVISFVDEIGRAHV